MVPTHRLPLVLLMIATTLPARGGVVSGVVLEQQSGVPLARARVRLDQVDATGRVQSETRIAGRAGQFTFASVPDGLFVLTASREGYAPIAYGQRRPRGTGPPFAVNRETNLFAELRLRKLGVITGRVFDENRVGIRRVNVNAYAVKPPFRAVAEAESDDRGIYRLHGLAEGKYRVRSQPFRHDDGLSMLPTFAPEMLTPRDSLVETARLDQEAGGVDVTPMAGELISVGGSVSCAPVTTPGPVIVTLATDTGRRQARTGCAGGSYLFENLSPGNYEVLGLQAEARLSAFVEQQVRLDTKNLNLELRPSPYVEFALRDDTGRTPVRAPGPLALTLRRVDPAGVAETRTLALDGETRPTVLSPGWWEVAAIMPAPYFLSGADQLWRRGEPRASADPDWFEFNLPGNARQMIALRTQNLAGGIQGKVTEKAVGVPGIPVFVWPADPQTRRQARGARFAYASLTGEFRFEGLPPGSYRVMASFDYDEVDEETVTVANAVVITVQAGALARSELTPYLAP